MKKPKISIVIALAPWRDAEILSSIKKQKYPKSKFEVIIRKGLNVPNNRNSGAAKAKGEIIAFLDDDAIIEPNFLNKVEELFDKHPEVMVAGGPQLTPLTDKFFARMNGYALSSYFATMGISKRYKKGEFTLNADSSHLTGALLICRKKLMKSIKFDENIYPADDVNFVSRAKSAGHTIAYSPDVFVYHRRRADLRGLIKQIFDYAKVRPQAQGLKQGLSTVFFFVPTLFMLYLLLLPTLSMLSKLFLIPLWVYIVLSLLVSSYEAGHHRSPLAIIVLPFMFLIIHIAYGAGFLTGLIDRLFKDKNK